MDSNLETTQLNPTKLGNPLTRFVLRFFSVYFLLYTFPFPFNYLPWLGSLISGIVTPWRTSLAQFVGRTVFGIEDMFVGMTGSGDTTKDYVLLFCYVVGALTVASLWSAIAYLIRPTKHPARFYDKLSRLLVTGCRYYVGMFMLAYGIAKVIPTQFPTPYLARYVGSYGDSSPMGLLWTFMGQSPAYTMFAGSGEVLGGLLLFFQRTRTLGALVVIGVMSNVVMMNFCYDVPVKLFSSHLLLMAIFIAMQDAPRLFKVFFLNRPTEPMDIRPLFGIKWLDVAAKVVALLLVGYFLVTSTYNSSSYYFTGGDGAAKHELYGIYEVEGFSSKGKELPPLLTDQFRWQRVVIDRPEPRTFAGREIPGTIGIQAMNDQLRYEQVDLDMEANKLTFLPPRPPGLPATKTDTKNFGELTFTRDDEGNLSLQGVYKSCDVVIELRKIPMEEFTLYGRGFNWINELPFNR